MIEDCSDHQPLTSFSITGSDDDEDELGEAAGSRSTGFLDWYGDPTRYDYLCRGRREAVIGCEMINDYANQPYLRPPLSMLQAAFLSGGLEGDDPSSGKKQRWEYGDSWQDELRSTWTDELDHAGVHRNPVSGSSASGSTRIGGPCSRVT